MKYSIKKYKWNNDTIKSVIALSKEWENEDITFGYGANSEKDIMGNDLFLAYSGDEAIGYLFGRLRQLEKAAAPLSAGSQCFEIEEIYVKKEFRSLSIGKQLFKYAEEYYKEKAEYITLSTATKNYKSILHFYIDELGMSFQSAEFFKEIS